MSMMAPWDKALDACQSEIGYLAVITTAEEDAFIINLKNSGVGDIFLTMCYWIGLFTNEKINTTSWVNGAIVGYSNIKMVDEQSGPCYGIKGDAWVAADCNAAFPFICERPCS